ncbi:MAG: hypothetical protein ACOCRK_01665 [bacterium]
MGKTLIQPGKAVNLKNRLTANPSGVEYEELKRNLTKHIKEKQDLKDLRKVKEDKHYSIDDIEDDEKSEGNTTFLLQPGMLME